MSLQDKQLMFSEAQSLVTTSLAQLTSTNIIDLGSPGTDVNGNTVPNDAGQSELHVDARITTDCAASGGAANMTFAIGMSDNEDGSSPTILSQTAPIAKATLVKGYKIPLDRVPTGATKRYLGLYYTADTHDFTAGAITAGLVQNSMP